MNRKALTHFDIDTCPNCAGIWFEDGELKALKASGSWKEIDDELEPSAVPIVQTDQLHCPKCDEAMDAIRFNFNTDITLNECMKCFGTWVDDGELSRMAESLRHDEANWSATDAAIGKALKEAENDILMANWELEHQQTISRYRRLRARAKALMTEVRRY
jgi:Zn-finger nucleic acid-binding protein